MTDSTTSPAPSATRQPEHLFYDGACGVCHWSVSFVAKRDDGSRFRFAALGGPTFNERVPAADRETLPDSIVVLTREGDLLLRSSAVAHTLRRLGGFWKLIGLLLTAVPRPLRDFGYDRIAAIRYRLAKGPEEACPLLPPALRARFDP